MPLINVKVIEGVFTPEQKIIERLTDAMVSIEGENTWTTTRNRNPRDTRRSRPSRISRSPLRTPRRTTAATPTRERPSTFHTAPSSCPRTDRSFAGRRWPARCMAGAVDLETIRTSRRTRPHIRPCGRLPQPEVVARACRPPTCEVSPQRRSSPPSTPGAFGESRQGPLAPRLGLSRRRQFDGCPRQLGHETAH